jgi:phosphoribosyl-AMP cyclohydrolase
VSAPAAADVDALVAQVRFGPDGLVVAVVQQHDTGEVLMVAWMDEGAVRETLTTRRGTYWSRSRQERWRKGDTSGNVQHVVRVSRDCDGDTLLVEVDQVGPACHTGTRTCFDGRTLLAAPDPTDDPTDRREVTP